MSTPSRLKALPRILLTGLLTVLPVIVTLAVLGWLAGTLESVLGGILEWLLPKGMYRTGMGFVAGLLLVFVVGVVMSTWLAQRLFSFFERAFLRVPLINSLYSAIKDMLALFSPDKERRFGSVVTFCLPGTDAKLVGFVTREDTSEWPGGLGGPDTVAVYLPMSYQIGGYMVLVPRERLSEVDMPVPDALRLALTAGVTGGNMPGSG
jgi:uncharacterized membrane protein